ncbi:MAG: histidine--tRNA ligase [Candidatus Bathyarchaeia archaeon]
MGREATRFQPLRGMKDYLPEDLAKRRHVEGTIRQLFQLYGYQEVETPPLEHYELLAAKVGDETRRAMYAFKDLGGRDVALRPEGTAPIARLVATKLRTAPKPLRLGYIWDFYRYDEPQFGRFRRFYQGGFELFGVPGLEGDLEILTLASDLMTRLGFKTFTVKVSNVAVLRGIMGEAGVSEEDQNAVLSMADKKRYTEALNRLEGLNVPQKTTELLSRLFGLKGLDYANVIREATDACGGSPVAVEALSSLRRTLDEAKAIFPNAALLVDLGFARGLEYYTGLIFEVFAAGLEIALIGGGRYDRLVELFGGEPTPAVGCAPGVDRLLLAMEKEGLAATSKSTSLIYLVPLENASVGRAAQIAYRLRNVGLPVEIDLSRRGLRRGLAYASQRGFPFVVILAREEMERGKLILRDMRHATQREVTIEELIAEGRQFLTDGLPKPA